MIDEKRLVLWEQATDEEMRGFPEKAVEMREILRLARLGLWAEKHGVPALHTFDEQRRNSLHLGKASRDQLDEALAALPKEKA